MSTAIAPTALQAGEVYSSDELAATGLTRRGLALALQRGELRQVRRCWYWVPPTAIPQALDHYRAFVIASLRAASARGVELALAGPTAALWWELPWFGPPPTRLTAAGQPQHGAKPEERITHIGQVPDDQLVRHRGAWVSLPGRTALDAARLTDERLGLAIMDAALHRGMTRPAELSNLLPDLARRHGVQRARWCAAHANALAESPGESISRYAIVKASLPLPILQHEIVLPKGSTARVDFYWHEQRLVGEFDGLVKYRGEDGGPSASKSVTAEKVREDALRELGYGVARWTWDEAWRPTAWLARLRRALQA